MSDPHEHNEEIPNLLDGGLPDILVMLAVGATVVAAVIAAVIALYFLAGFTQNNWQWTAWL